MNNQKNNNKKYIFYITNYYKQFLTSQNKKVIARSSELRKDSCVNVKTHFRNVIHVAVAVL
jgi:hypothetical protein